MGRRLLPLALLFFPPPAAAQAPVRFPAGATYIIEMTGPATLVFNGETDWDNFG